MKAVYSKGMIHVYANPKMTDISKVDEVVKRLVGMGYLDGVDDSEEGVDYCIGLCTDYCTTIEEMKEDFNYCKKG